MSVRVAPDRETKLVSAPLARNMLSFSIMFACLVTTIVTTKVPSKAVSMVTVPALSTNISITANVSLAGAEAIVI